MALEGGMACIKYLVLLFNLLFWLSGLGLIIVGAMAQMHIGAFSVVTGNLSGAPYVIIAVGVVIFVVAAFGCCGAHKESYFMVATFSVFLFLIFVAELAAGIGAYIFKDQLRDVVETKAKVVINDYPTKNKDPVDNMQKELQCCGVVHYQDWFNSTNWVTSDPNNPNSVPDSCCLNVTSGCGQDIRFKNATAIIYTKGCVEKLEATMKENIVLVGGVAIGIGFAQLIGIILACCLMRGIKNSYQAV
ncbi:CD63 antigen-like isoform X1 [Petromyzon marinus]|uniref:Tetraspanin n=1 Tax=Petromyzon marinus TaxID=7757 RepID=A0AAJ7SM93_PETMA|nr:CD63 antigen-like isoform X1 [Petromyzon marinus]XP_032801943.1 CD63 antigen-like isoform X1 [Petromyzon marinus]XP_032801945.1 CD63 antigen-like isoform X1 [Petromyzon marinus]